MAERLDLYRVLQVDPSANPLVIQAAYRALAQIFHPDVSGDSDEMKRLNAAWEVLGDPKRRRQYDIECAGRHAPQAPQMPHTTQVPHVAPDAARYAATHATPGGATPTTARVDDHAGPPPDGPAAGSVMRFGRYEGWSIGQIARVDPTFLEWLRRAPAGRGLKDEIEVALQRADGARRLGIRRPATEPAASQPVHTWAPGAPTRVR